MNRELMKQCLDALSRLSESNQVEFSDIELIESIRAELEKSEPEPVATVQTIRGVRIGYLEKHLPDGTKLYTKGTTNV